MYRPLLTNRICRLIHGLGLYSAFLLWLSITRALMNASGGAWGSVSCLRQEQPGIKPPTMCLVDDLLYLLSHTAEPPTLEKHECMQVNLDLLYLSDQISKPPKTANLK